MTEEQRADLIVAVERALWRIHDADELVKIALVTGFTVEELRNLGGLA